ncbi:MAG: ATP-dependent DNA helicase RecG, partial [bacterium]
MPPRVSFPLMVKADTLDKIRRPLEFVSRDNFSKMDAVAGLERSVSAWVGELEASGPPQPVRSALEDLRGALRGFDALGFDEKRARVETALRALDHIERGWAQTPSKGRRSGRQGAGNRRTRPDRAQSFLTDTIQAVRGVGPRRAETLARLGIQTIGDALFFLPRKYVDRSRLQAISALQVGRAETFLASVLGGRVAFIGRGRRIYEVTLGDSTGVVTCIWFAFRTAYLKERYQPGKRFLLSGVVRSNPRRGGRLEVHHPEVEEAEGEGSGGESIRMGRETLHTGRIVPFYPAMEGLNQRSFRSFMKRVVDDFSGRVVDVIPKEIVERRGLGSLPEAIRGVHFPPEGADVESLNSGRSPWHRRLIFDELFCLQTGLALRKDKRKRRRRRLSYRLEGLLTSRFLRDLPFALTEAQHRILGEIGGDLLSPSPMNRLLQGDVGSGKTVVAAWAALAAIQSGHQAVIMAPTEILAEQHADRVRLWTDPLEVQSALLTGRIKGKARAKLLEGAAEGSISLIVGTHALIQQDVRFRSLGLAVVDEQHRFGVMQRSALRGKGGEPDVLVMTATPIPRSLALTLYGDLDFSVLDEMPPGRMPVETLVYVGEAEADAWRLLQRELAAGGRAYFVLPLVEETEKSDLKAAVETAERLRRQFHPLPVGLLHGRMKGEEKEAVMRRFREGGIRLLVTTTVIEVGVDVPDATVMWVEHADRYGLAQLHQLRGRVGRGPEKSYCVLRASPPLTGEAEARLAVMAETSDGFQIADRDLEIRGPGEMFGIRQAGAPELRLTRLLRHTGLLAQAREDAFHLVGRDPALSAPGNGGLYSWVRERWGEKLALADVGCPAATQTLKGVQIIRGAFLGATRPSELAVPPAPRAGPNNRISRLQTLCPAKKKQEVTDPKLCLPPAPPAKLFTADLRSAYSRCQS